MSTCSVYIFATSLLLSLIAPKESDLSAGDAHGGRCTGKVNCTACSSCNYCKHCNSGGSCGVCGGGSSSGKSTYSSSSSGTSSTYFPSSSGGSVLSKARYYIDADLLNVRSGPGSDYSVVGRVSRGEVISGTSSISSSWVKIDYVTDAEGSVRQVAGYVSKKYLIAY
ncbi:SH3 domain-containing protein [uncultured Pontibacter sp.]|uniref:SH3 domain-containing protein n=1 Tax=uncultured Pontibacter sp. TaxID=453356 RepID=UPI00260B7FC8|nr:SH3 domain-containing protein [uncultured Pontibacter sp.]